MRYKYPRTYHLPHSEGCTSDDKKLSNYDNFIGKEIIITEKRDGENSTLYTDYTHARSLDSADHPSRHWLKNMWTNICYNIPKGWRICGENLYAKHSIYYENLETYFEVFSIWNEKNECLSWDETLEWCELLNLKHVPILWRGKFDEEFIKQFKVDTELQEGYVIRIVDSFKYNDFEKSIAKYVRKDHVQTDNHWMNSKIIPNGRK